MPEKTEEEFKEQLNDLQLRLELWRSNRTTHRIPMEIWTEAARLAKVGGVSQVSSALKLEYPKLKNLSGEGQKRGPGKKGKKDEATFLELPLPSSLQGSQSGFEPKGARRGFRFLLKSRLAVIQMSWGGR